MKTSFAFLCALTVACSGEFGRAGENAPSRNADPSAKTAEKARIDALLNKAEALIAQEKLPTAIKTATEAIRQSPKNARAYKLRGKAKLRTADANPVRLQMSYNMTIHSKAADSTTLVEGAGNARKRDLGLNDLDKAVRLAPNDNEPRLLIARCLYQRWETVKAVRMLDGLIANRLKSNSDLAEAWWQRGQCATRRKDSRASIRDYGRAIALEPKSVKYIVSRARVYQSSGQRDKAIAELSRAIKLDNANASAYLNRGFAYNMPRGRKRGDSDSARLQRDYKRGYADCAKVLQLNANELQMIRAHLGCATAMQKQREHRREISHLDKAIDLIGIDRKPLTLPKRKFAFLAFMNRSFAVFQLNKNDAAITDLNRALRFASNPREYITAYRARRVFHKHLGAVALAKRDLQIAEWYKKRSRLILKHRAEPRNPDPLVDLAEHYLHWHYELPQLNDVPIAVEFYNRAIALAPESAMWRCRRAELHLRLGQFQKALADCDVAIRLKTRDLNKTYLLRGKVHLKLKHYDQAIEDFKRGRAFGPLFAEAYRARAKAHEAAGRKKQAAEDRRRAAAISPSLKPVRKTARPFPK